MEHEIEAFTFMLNSESIKQMANAFKAQFSTLKVYLTLVEF